VRWESAKEVLVPFLNERASGGGGLLTALPLAREHSYRDAGGAGGLMSRLERQRSVGMLCVCDAATCTRRKALQPLQPP
jgi:hypothetical protein